MNKTSLKFKTVDSGLNIWRWWRTL